MQSVSTLYKRLLADPEHVREAKVNIAGTEYGQDRIFTCSVSGDLFPDAAAGGTISREIDLTIEPNGPIPRMAQISLFSRLSSGGEVSEWLPRGVYYVDTRETSQATGLLSIHGFDAMLKAEETWLDPSDNTGEWPISQKTAVEDIAGRMGISVDPRSQFRSGYRVEYPNDLTMREVLKYIALCHGGNWSMTGDGQLLLTPLGGLPEETSYLIDGMDGGAILFGEVRLIV